MRVLLDEMMPRRLKRMLSETAEVMSVRERGWGSLENSDLLEAAQHEFDVLLTTDRGIPHQQNLSRFEIAVVVLRARSNAYEELAPLAEKASEVLTTARSGHALFIEA